MDKLPGLPYENLVFRARLEKLVTDISSLKDISERVAERETLDDHSDWDYLNVQILYGIKQLNSYVTKYSGEKAVNGFDVFSYELLKFLQLHDAPRPFSTDDDRKIGDFVKLANKYKGEE